MVHKKYKKSLTRGMLISIGMRIGVVIIIMTGLAYFHMVASLEASSLGQLDKYMTERGQRERSIFQLSEKNLYMLRDIYIERMGEAGAAEVQDYVDRFKKRFVAFEDGVTRNRLDGFDARKQSRVFWDDELAFTDAGIVKTMIAYDVSSIFGRAIHHTIEATFFVGPENVMVGYWPEKAMSLHHASKDMDFTKLNIFDVTRKDVNPERELRWTGLYYVPVVDSWMISGGLPVDIDGKNMSLVGHLLTVDDLFKRAISDHLDGAYNMIVSKGGQLVAHGHYMDKIKGHKGPLMLRDFGDAHLTRLYDQVLGMEEGEIHIFENTIDGEYIAVAYLDEPGWYFMAVLSKSVVSSQAMSVAWFVLLIGFCSLILEICVLYYILRKHVAKPLKEFEAASNLIIQGVYDHRLVMERDDELGGMADSFNRMADAVSERDGLLEANNIELEQRVKDRTMELEKTHKKLLDVSRMVGMSQVAGNVLHQVGNIMSSIIVSVDQLRARVLGGKGQVYVDVGRKLRENHESLGKYIADDEQGEFLIDFLEKSGDDSEEQRRSMLLEVDDAFSNIQKVIGVLEDQRKYTHRDAIMVESSLMQISHDLDKECELKWVGGMHLRNLITDHENVLVDAFKIKAIIWGVFESIENRFDGVEVVLSGEINSVNSELEFMIEHGVSGCEYGDEEKMFFHAAEYGGGQSLHFSSILASELGGELQAESLGVDQGMIYRLRVPYAKSVGLEAA